MRPGRRSSRRTPTARRAASTGRESAPSARSGASSTAGGRTSPSIAGTSTSFSRRARTPSSTTTTTPGPGSPSVRSAADSLDEAAVRRVQVEDARASPGAPEPVPRAGRRGDEAAGAEHHRLVACRELDLPLEHEERVGVVVVRVGIDDERLVEVDLDRADVGQVDADQPVAVGAVVYLALAGAADDRFCHSGIV